MSNWKRLSFFISYRHKDAEIAHVRALAEKIASAGHDVDYWDKFRGPASGSVWDDIKWRIDRCDIMLVLVTDKIHLAKGVDIEVEYALSIQKRMIIPLVCTKKFPCTRWPGINDTFQIPEWTCDADASAFHKLHEHFAHLESMKAQYNYSSMGLVAISALASLCSGRLVIPPVTMIPKDTFKTKLIRQK